VVGLVLNYLVAQIRKRLIYWERRPDTTAPEPEDADAHNVAQTPSRATS
jgi:hypothetical protein